MGALEIFLIIFGIILVVVSFVFGEHLSSMDNKNSEYDGNVAKVTKEIVKKEVEAEVANVIDEKLEQAEVKLDKLTNEKIMALGDYSDDVNFKITKNHDEVMFLYDMLSDKEKTIKNTVKDVEALKASIKNLPNGTGIDENSHSVSKSGASDKAKSDKINKEAVLTEKTGSKPNMTEKSLKNSQAQTLGSVKAKSKQTIGDKALSDTTNTSKTEASNENKEILELYREGKSAVEIAQRLGRGVGEVQLIIGLYNNKQ